MEKQTKYLFHFKQQAHFKAWEKLKKLWKMKKKIRKMTNSIKTTGIFPWFFIIVKGRNFSFFPSYLYTEQRLNFNILSSFLCTEKFIQFLLFIFRHRLYNMVLLVCFLSFFSVLYILPVIQLSYWLQLETLHFLGYFLLHYHLC